MKKINTIKVSIAMTVYNGERFLLEQLQSIQEQTWPADEVIVVDDASTDSSPQIMQDFIRQNNLSHWKYYRHPVNKGFVQTFRTALSYVETGDIIFLCDQDDIWIPEKIAHMAAFFERNPKASMLAGGFTLIDEHGETISYDNMPKKYKADKRKRDRNFVKKDFKIFTWEKKKKMPMALGCVTAVTRPLVQAYLSMPIYAHPHDTSLSSMALLSQSFYSCRLTLIKYRLHSSNTSKITYKKNIEGFYKKYETKLANLNDLIHIIFHAPDIPYKTISSAGLIAHMKIETYEQVLRIIKSDKNTVVKCFLCFSHLTISTLRVFFIRLLSS